MKKYTVYREVRMVITVEAENEDEAVGIACGKCLNEWDYRIDNEEVTEDY